MSDNEKCQNEPPKCDNKSCDHYRKDGCLAGCTPPWELKALQDKIAELEADKERLDWLELHTPTVRYDWGCNSARGWEIEDTCITKDQDLRGSIDKARK